MLCPRVVTLLAFLSSVVRGAAQFSGYDPPSFRGKFTKVSRELIFNTANVLSEDMEMSAEVTTGNMSSYTYLHGTFGPLTLIIRPCSGSINVTIFHIPNNNTGFLKDYLQGRSDTSLAKARGKQVHVFSWPDTPAGLYLFDLMAEERDTMVTMYATSLPSVPPALRIVQTPRVSIQPRLHRNRVTLRWDQSIIDPQTMEYCVAVNSRKNFSSLCEANFAFGMNVHTASERSYLNKSQGHRDAGQYLGKYDVFITCVGARLSYTISHLQKGREYFFNIFAKNRRTRLSFLYANKYLKYESRLRPLGLRDNKPATVNIRRLGGKALFRYKVSKMYIGKNTSSLSWHIMPCGGTVQVEISMQRQVVVPRQTVEGYQHLRIPNPQPGMRYVLLVYVTDSWQMRQIRGIEVLATMKVSPLPQLPQKAIVYEWYSLRTCDSITVGWEPVTAQTVKYCVSASPLPSTEAEYYFRTRPNQCNLDNRLQKELDFATRQCQEYSANDNRNMLIETITKLHPGREYLIQVTVKKIKGKALSYDLLRVQTKSSC